MKYGPSIPLTERFEYLVNHAPQSAIHVSIFDIQKAYLENCDYPLRLYQLVHNFYILQDQGKILYPFDDFRVSTNENKHHLTIYHYSVLQFIQNVQGLIDCGYITLTSLEELENLRL